MIYTQAMTIGKIQKERDSSDSKKNEAEEKFAALEKSEAKFRTRVGELEKQISDEKAEYQKSLAEIRSNVVKEIEKLEKEVEVKNQRIKNLEQQLLSIKNIKSDPGGDEKEKLLQDKIVEMQSVCNKSDKTVKELQAELESKTNSESLLQKNIDELKTQSENEIKEANENYNKRIKEMEIQHESRKNIQTSLRNKIIEIQQNNNLLQRKVDEYKALAEEQKKTINGFEKQLQSSKKEAFNLQEKLSKMEATETDSIDTAIHFNALEVQKLNYEEVIKGVKTNLEGREKENAALKLIVENLTKNLSDEQNNVVRIQNEMNEMKNKLAAVITVATKAENNLRSEIKNATQTKHESPAITAEKENKIKELKKRFISLDEIRKGTRMSYECLLRDIVVKVARVSYASKTFYLYSTLEPSEKPIKFALKKLFFKLHITDELEINTTTNLSAVMSLIHDCTLTKLVLGENHIGYTDFMKLISSHTIKNFIGGHVHGESGKELEINKILEELTNIETFEISRCYVSRDMCQKLVELPTFPNLQQVTLRLSTAFFKLEDFEEFILKYPSVQFFFKFENMCKTDKIVAKEKQFRESLPSNSEVSIQYSSKK
uniref:Uncharacterized protein n=1 Tax=Panagrolaimus sp. ES5 TaxID=591445 RepID=A0AC34FG95_9BILA